MATKSNKKSGDTKTAPTTEAASDQAPKLGAELGAELGAAPGAERATPEKSTKADLEGVDSKTTATQPAVDQPAASEVAIDPSVVAKSTASKAVSSKATDCNAEAKKSSSRARAAAAARSKKAANLIQRDWLAHKNSSQQEEAAPYSMKKTYALNAVIEHPKFGTGFVTAVMPHKVQVTFQDQVLFLVHAREAS